MTNNNISDYINTNYREYSIYNNSPIGYGFKPYNVNYFSAIKVYFLYHCNYQRYHGDAAQVLKGTIITSILANRFTSASAGLKLSNILDIFK